jgi:hypothetical protein
MDTFETYQGAKFLVVLCAGSALLLVEDTLTSIVNGAFVGVSDGFRSIVNQKNSYGCEQESQDII